MHGIETNFKTRYYTNFCNWRRKWRKTTTSYRAAIAAKKNTYILPATPKRSAHNPFGLWVLWYLCLCDPGLLSILHSEVGRGFKTHNLIDIKAEVEFKSWTYPLTHEMTKLPIRWELGSLNKQNKNFEQNCIFERASRGTIVRVTISMSIYKCQKPHQG